MQPDFQQGKFLTGLNHISFSKLLNCTTKPPKSQESSAPCPADFAPVRTGWKPFYRKKLCGVDKVLESRHN